MKVFRYILAPVAAFAMASGAQAALQVPLATVVGPAATASPCTNFTFSVTIIACAGGYEGNLQQGSVTDATALSALLALGAPAGTYLEPKLDGLDSEDGIIDFGTLLTGLTVFGIHTGKAGDETGNATFFFQFDAGAGVDIITITDRFGANEGATGLSNAALFQTGTPRGVPEPGTWAMMLLGFGGIGYSMRSRRRRGTALQIA